MNQPSALLFAAACVLIVSGCQKPAVTFPVQSMGSAAQAVGAFRAYDANRDGKADYFLFANASGRIDRIGYDRLGGQKPTEVISLDGLPAGQCRHLVLILDGFGYDVVKKFYDQGHLRYCNAPSRVIAPYPTLTDLCLEDAFGYTPCRAFEAQYFDYARNQVAGGSSDYLAGANMPYNHLLDYRAGAIWDAIGYLWPMPVFNHEINDSYRRFTASQSPEFIAYYVSSAGVGTSRGAAGQEKCLERVEQFIDQAVWQTRGLTKVTILADHGHSYKPSARIPFEKLLPAKGWRVRTSLDKPRDVVQIRFGLETCASFNCSERQALASDLVKIPGVELASYAEGAAVVVYDGQGGKARVHRKAAWALRPCVPRASCARQDPPNQGRDAHAASNAGFQTDSESFRYEVISGDPLRLKDILPKRKADAEGFYDAATLFDATNAHEYPDPLQRLWRAHFALAQNTPDVIVSLADGYYAGSAMFAGLVNVASTHGGLNRNNSTTFVMSSAGALPPVLRSIEIPAALRKALGSERWPLLPPNAGR